MSSKTGTVNSGFACDAQPVKTGPWLHLTIYAASNERQFPWAGVSWGWTAVAVNVSSENAKRATTLDFSRLRTFSTTNKGGQGRWFLTRFASLVSCPFFPLRLVYTYDASISTSISHVWTGTTQAQAQEKGTRAYACARVALVHTWLMLVLASYVWTSL